MIKKYSKYFSFLLLLIISFSMSGCTKKEEVNVGLNSDDINHSITTEYIEDLATETTDEDSFDTPTDTPDITETTISEFDINTVPAWNGQDAWYVVNNNVPFFTTDEIISESFETYSPLDNLGRCQVANSCLSKDTMPAEGEKRGEIGKIKPSGWHTVKYPELISDLYLYNRCHLIGWQLSAENANELNLITGTRYLNIEGMLPFENLVNDYIDETGNHVMYRVTPVYINEELVARGVLMEGLSVEDNTISFCVWCYNVQPGITIDYETGDSYITENGDVPTSNEEDTTVNISDDIHTYILNTNSMKIHKPDCKYAAEISDNNKHEYTGHLEDLLSDNYSVCKYCNPD